MPHHHACLCTLLQIHLVEEGKLQCADAVLQCLCLLSNQNAKYAYVIIALHKSWTQMPLCVHTTSDLQGNMSGLV